MDRRREAAPSAFQRIATRQETEGRCAGENMKIGGHKLEITHEDKIFFSKAKITKGDVVDYFRRLAEVMLPRVRGRPLAMRRHPAGLKGERFVQKESPDHVRRG